MVSKLQSTDVATPAEVLARQQQERLDALLAVKDHKSDAAHAILAAVGDDIANVASDEAVQSSDERVRSLTEQLSDVRNERDRLVTFRNERIAAALSVKFTVRDIADTFRVSRGTVQGVADARKLRAALVAGGNKNPGNVTALIGKVQNLPSGTKVADVVTHARETGEVLKPEPTSTRTVSGKTAAARLSGAVDAIEAATSVGDDEIGAIRDMLRRIERNMVKRVADNAAAAREAAKA